MTIKGKCWDGQLYRVIRSVQGTLTPWFRFISLEGVATLLTCALGSLTPWAALETLTPRAPVGTIFPRGFKAGLICTRRKSLLGQNR